MTYAATTDVPAEKSQAEIQRTVTRYRARNFMFGYDDRQAVVRFQIPRFDGDTLPRLVQFAIPLPDRQAREFTHTPQRGTARSAEAARKAYDQAVRAKWRALGLIIKAKLEAVASGVTGFDDEFLANIVLPDGTTVGQRALPGVEEAYELGTMPDDVLALPAG